MTTTFDWIETNGVRLHVALAGPEDGELVVLLHGFPEFWKGMNAPLEAFAAAGYRVVAPDQRGYNLSDKPQGVDAYSLDVLAADVVGLIDAMGHERAHVIGHDWGAAVTWWLAITCPERLRRVAVINVPHPSVLVRQLRRNPRQLARSWYMAAFQLPWLPERAFVGRAGERLASALARTANPGSFTADYLGDLCRAWSQPGAPTAMLNWYRAALRRRPADPADPAELSVHEPILILWGVNDVALGRSLADESLTLCDEGHLVLFDDATHWLLHDEPGQACRLLVDWVAERDLAPLHTAE